MLVGFVFFVCSLSFYLCGRLPSASQLGWLGPLRHSADVGQTQLRLSLLSRKSQAAACPSPSGAAWQRAQ